LFCTRTRRPKCMIFSFADNIEARKMRQTT